MSLIGVFHRYTYIFHGYSGISVVFRYFGDSCNRFEEIVNGRTDGCTHDGQNVIAKAHLSNR